MTVARLIALAGCALFALVVIPLAKSVSTTMAATAEEPSVMADCSKGSGIGRGNVSAFASRNNLVVGPLAMAGAAIAPAHYSEAFGGNKFPLYVLAGHRVRVELSADTRRGAGLYYNPRKVGAIPARGYRSITFIACRRGQLSPGLGAPAGRVSFWSGGIRADSPRCVPLRFWVDDERRPRTAVIRLGVGRCVATPVAEAPAVCTANEVQSLTVSFVEAFNAGATDRLDRIFAKEPDFEWYSTSAPGERLMPEAEERDSLMDYFRTRHAFRERLTLTSFSFTGNSAVSGPVGNFQYRLTREADDLSPSSYAGKGAARCYRNRPDALIVWLMRNA